MNTRYFHSVSSSTVNGNTKKVEKILKDGEVVVTEYKDGAQTKKYLEPPLKLLDNFGLVVNRPVKKAVAVVRRCDTDKRVGVITLEQYNDMLHIHVSFNLRNFRDGKHGFHVHKCGDERNQDKKCSSLCSHYSRSEDDVHGGRTSYERHNGDLGNIMSINGNVDEKISIQNMYLDIEECIGRAFVIHDDEDDLGLGGDEESKKTGNAGKRIAYALVGRL
jgi:superoxide dismutase, Cu-Zn family